MSSYFVLPFRIIVYYMYAIEGSQVTILIHTIKSTNYKYFRLCDYNQFVYVSLLVIVLHTRKKLHGRGVHCTHKCTMYSIQCTVHYVYIVYIVYIVSFTCYHIQSPTCNSQLYSPQPTIRISS